MSSVPDESALPITLPGIDAYCADHSHEESAGLNAIRKATEQRFPHVQHMMIGSLQAAFFRNVIRSTGAIHVLELGTFTGYSALAFAEALPPEGKVITLDRDPVAVAVGREHWGQSVHGIKIESLLGPASESLERISNELKNGTRKKPDFIFIDADKSQNLFYLEWAMKNVAVNGNIFVDNVLWKGKVLHPADNTTKHIIKLNEFIKSCPQLDRVLLPIRDGLWWLRLRSACESRNLSDSC